MFRPYCRGLALLALGFLIALPAARSADPAGLDEIRQLLGEGRAAAAEARARELLRETEVASGALAPETADVLDLLVEALWRGGKSKERETRELARRALAIREEQLGPDDARVAVSLNNLGIVCSDSGDYDAAQSAYERALSIQERIFGNAHAAVATTLDNLGVVAFNRGEYAAARGLHERALTIHERTLGPDSRHVASSLISLAGVLIQTGDYAQARPLCERALAIQEREHGAEHPYVARTLNDLGWLFAATGDYSRARSLYGRALSIVEKVLGPEHGAVAHVLNNLGELLLKTDGHEQARPIFERALSITEKTHDPDHIHVAQGLTHLADVVLLSGELTRAAALYERALATWERTVGVQQAWAAHALYNLGNVSRAQGDARQAEVLHERALAIRRQVLGDEHPDVAESLTSLAVLHLERNERGRAFEEALRAEAIGRDHLRLTVQALPDREALRYAAVRVRGLDIPLALAAETSDPAWTRSAWDALIHSRALVLDEMAGRHRASGRASDAEGARLARRLLETRTRLASLVVAGPRDTTPDNYRKLLDEARQQDERAERELAARSVVFREDLYRASIGLDAVAAALPADGALMAFARYHSPAPRRQDGSASTEKVGAEEPHYLAFILGARAAQPVVVRLGPAGVIDGLVAAWQREMASVRQSVGRSGPATEARYREVAERLRRAIWDPIEDRLPEVRLVFIVPDGALFLVNWATLPTGDDRYLLERAPTIHYLSAERDLVSQLPPARPAGKLLALGGPDFDQAGPATVARLTSATVAAPDVSGPVYRAPTAACTDFRSLRFAPLPGAEAEAELVASLWETARSSEAGKLRAARLLGGHASEERFKRESPDSAVLHVATHGFFIGGRCSVPLSITSPLLLTGLALAGANRRDERDRADASTDDGILTAEEIASLDLVGVDWAVLSSCGSGLGELLAGEGILGLRRAFHVAGVDTVIMSLWEVDDASSQHWVASLYRSRLAGATAVDAVRQASLDLLRARRRAGLSAHPFFWGVFVAAGDWR